MKSKEMDYSRGGQTAHFFHCPVEDGRVFKSTLSNTHPRRHGTQARQLLLIYPVVFHSLIKVFLISLQSIQLNWMWLHL